MAKWRCRRGLHSVRQNKQSNKKCLVYLSWRKSAVFGKLRRQGEAATLVHLIHDNLLSPLAAAVGGRRVEPRFPAGRQATLPSADLPEAAPTDAGTSPKSPLMLFIAYRDAQGRASERRVTVRAIHGNPPHILLCFCHERRAFRHFRFDRIIEAVHPETGEVFVGHEIIEAISDAGYQAVDPFMKRLVIILVFVMRCDGRADLEEWEVIDDAITDWSSQFDNGKSASQAMIMARRIAPDSDDMLTALGGLLTMPGRSPAVRFLSRSVQRLIGADGVEAPDEFAWAVELHAVLQRIERL